MNKYCVNVQEISHGFVEVEANSEEEAKNKATDMFHSGNVNWGDMDFEITSVNAV